MRKRDRKALATYVRWVANELELRDWTVQLEHTASVDQSDPLATVHCVYGSRHLVIEFRGDFRRRDREDQRETVVHELLHAQRATTWSMVQRDLCEPLGKVAYYVFCDAYRRAMEYEVDAEAKAFAKHMPLIAWPK